MSLTFTLKDGRETVVDDDVSDLLRAHAWAARLNGYSGKRYVTAIVRGDRTKTRVRLHRIIMGAKPGEVVDHKNGDTLDNRRENLRICTQAQNVCNAVSRGRRFKGTFKRGVTWHVCCVVAGRQHHGGTYRTEVEAALAYDLLAEKLHGEFARFNFTLEERAAMPAPQRVGLGYRSSPSRRAA